jgi:hypothetical protein
LNVYIFIENFTARMPHERIRAGAGKGFVRERGNSFSSNTNSVELSSAQTLEYNQFSGSITLRFIAAIVISLIDLSVFIFAQFF